MVYSVHSGSFYRKKVTDMSRPHSNVITTLGMKFIFPPMWVPEALMTQDDSYFVAIQFKLTSKNFCPFDNFLFVLAHLSFYIFNVADFNFET